MTREEVREIADEVADKAAEKAVRSMLTALGFDLENLHEEQQVWAFARTMQQGTRRGVRALFTGTLTAFATLLVGWLWWLFGAPKH